MKLRSECSCRCHQPRSSVKHISRCCRVDPPPAADIHAAINQLDGSRESAVALISGVPVERIQEYGGLPDEETT